MTERERFLKQIGEVYASAAKVLTQRSVKYAPEDDPFANIKESAEIADTDVYQSIMTRFGDKVGRIRQCLRAKRQGDSAEAADESLHDSIVDAINYLVLLRVYLGEEEQLDSAIEEKSFQSYEMTEEEKSTNWFDTWRNKFGS